MGLSWHDRQAIAQGLFERYDTLDPHTVRLADLRKWVLDLEDFEGRPEDTSDAVLQAIQQAWWEQWHGEYGS